MQNSLLYNIVFDDQDLGIHNADYNEDLGVWRVDLYDYLL